MKLKSNILSLMGFSHKETNESQRVGYFFIFFYVRDSDNENPRVSYNSQISNSLCYTKLNQPISNEDSRREMKRSAQMLMIIMLLCLFFISSTCNQVQKYYLCNMF